MITYQVGRFVQQHTRYLLDRPPIQPIRIEVQPPPLVHGEGIESRSGDRSHGVERLGQERLNLPRKKSGGHQPGGRRHNVVNRSNSGLAEHRRQRSEHDREGVCRLAGT